MWFGMAPSGAAVFGVAWKPRFHPRLPASLRDSGLIRELGAVARAARRENALSAPATVSVPLTFFLPVRVELDDWGRPWAVPQPTNRFG